jgi:hypothetical protein
VQERGSQQDGAESFHHAVIVLLAAVMRKAARVRT